MASCLVKPRHGPAMENGKMEILFSRRLLCPLQSAQLQEVHCVAAVRWLICRVLWVFHFFLVFESVAVSSQALLPS